MFDAVKFRTEGRRKLARLELRREARIKLVLKNLAGGTCNGIMWVK